MGWAEGVGCDVGVGAVSWGVLDGTLGTSCVARKRSIHLSLSRPTGGDHAWETGAQECVLAKQRQALALGLPSRR